MHRKNGRGTKPLIRLPSYSGVLRPGMTREDAEYYLRAKAIPFRQCAALPSGAHVPTSAKSGKSTPPDSAVRKISTLHLNLLPSKRILGLDASDMLKRVIIFCAARLSLGTMVFPCSSRRSRYHSPYGIQIFFTWVACWRNQRPSPCFPSNQSMERPSLVNTCLRFPIE